MDERFPAIRAQAFRHDREHPFIVLDMEYPRPAIQPAIDDLANAKDAEVVRFEDDATLITVVASGQVDLVSTQTAVLAAMNEKKGGDPLDVKFVQKSLDLGIAQPQNEPKLKEWLNNWITEKFKSGELPAMFKKFHKRDLPADLLSRKD